MRLFIASCQKEQVSPEIYSSAGLGGTQVHVREEEGKLNEAVKHGRDPRRSLNSARAGASWGWRVTAGEVLRPARARRVPCSQAEGSRPTFLSRGGLGFPVKLNDRNFVFGERAECKEVGARSNPLTAGCAEAVGAWGRSAQRSEQRVWCERAQGVFLSEPSGEPFIQGAVFVLREAPGLRKVGQVR